MKKFILTFPVTIYEKDEKKIVTVEVVRAEKDNDWDFYKHCKTILLHHFNLNGQFLYPSYDLMYGIIDRSNEKKVYFRFPFTYDADGDIQGLVETSGETLSTKSLADFLSALNYQFTQLGYSNFEVNIEDVTVKN